MSSSGGKMPEYTMLTPLPPEVMPPGDFEQLVGMGFPCHEFVPHYSFVNMVPVAPPPVEEPAHSSTPDVDEGEEEEERGGEGEGKKDPFAPHCKIPLPTPFSPYEYWLEPSFIRRRNERERQRVRNVNDGFERLKSHIPLSSKDKDKRLSKVEILRMAIRYIHNLQDMLKGETGDDSKENVACLDSEESE